jgi:hypothetical protein
MPIYTFYLRRRDGRASTFEAFELRDDQFAPAQALQTLGEHPSSASVDVWSGDRKVLSNYRGDRETPVGPSERAPRADAAAGAPADAVAPPRGASGGLTDSQAASAATRRAPGSRPP